ncbi:catabolic L-serine/threonine dehydratase [Paecilomyces lecythidis]|uniref:Catabolic L-serine/threonine dehydratase n=1 Tax=Paecilomyces lecythidis TaxID=3004212 RepID=A0ABR3X893_9EURO
MANRRTPESKRPWIETPLVESSTLSRAVGWVFLKLENLQPSGSFKSRAMGSLILSHLSNPANANRDIHFYISSGGNAGLAAVCAARSLSYPCTVVVPRSTRSIIIRKLRDAGATDVIAHGETIAKADEYMHEVVMKERREGENADVVKIALHPFDHEAIWDGNSTIVDELAHQLPPDDDDYQRAVPADAIICSVGGGGLLNGLVMGIERQKRLLALEQSSAKKDINILAVETEGTASLALAMSKKSLVSLPAITSQASSLGVVRVSSRTLEYSLSPPQGIAIHSVVLSDADAARGVLRLVDDERLLVELACGVCVEAAIGDAQRQNNRKRKRSGGTDEGYGSDPTSSDESNPGSRAVSCASDTEDTDVEADSTSQTVSKLRKAVPDLNPESRVVIVVCGGSNITLDMAAEWREKLKDGWGSKKGCE